MTLSVIVCYCQWCEPSVSARPWFIGVIAMSRLLSAVMLFGWLVVGGRTEVTGQDREVQPYLGSYQVGEEELKLVI